MARIKLNFRKSVAQQVEKTREIILQSTGNPNLVNPVPSLADLATAADSLELASIEASGGDKDEKAIMRIRRKELKVLIVRFADFVQTQSGGDEEIILSSGFEVRKQPSPIPVPAIPPTVKVLPATHEGQLVVVVKPVRDASAYLFRMYPGSLSEAPVIIGASVKKGRFVAQNLNGLSRYWFSVCAMNASGMSGWSDPAMGITL
ncbi:MAG: hypothetical protein IPP77_09430 [Bacteroidetes bacterium]|nr:hypothetical protein [Bacteroidota bacterium]